MNKLHFGVGREIISPPVGTALYGYFPDHFSESLSDDLTATAFFFSQGDTKALAISLTLGSLQTELSDRIRACLSERLNIPYGAILLCATHTHSGPNTVGEYGWGDINLPYCEEILIPRVLAAASTAVSHSREAHMGIAVGESRVGINRRERTLERGVILGQNPWGCYDPKMTVLSFRDARTGEELADLVHYGAHCTGAGANREISRDWAGVMIDRMEEAFGGITAFFNGTEGDTGPRLSNGETTGDLSLALALGEIAARDAIAIRKQITDVSAPFLDAQSVTLEVPLSPRTDMETAKREYEKCKEDTVNLSGAKQKHYRELLDSYAKGERDRDSKQIEQVLLRLGNVVFASFPYELFSEIGLRIAHEFPDHRILSLSVTNGTEGYFVTEDQIPLGGYEVEMFLNGHLQPYRTDGDTHLVQQTVKHIQQLLKKQTEV